MRKSSYLITILAATGVALLGQAGRVTAGPWDMDTTYGQGGFVAGASWEMIGRPGGSLLKATSTSNGAVLKRFDSNGVQDPLFGSAGQLEITYPAGFESRGGSIPEIDAAGRYLWCGRADLNGDGVGDLAILRVMATGIPDPGFGEGGVTSRMTDPLPAGASNKYGNWCQSLAIQPDGRIVAGVGHGNPVPGEGSSVRRFNSDGSDDASFGGTGRVGVSAYNFPGVQVLPNGWIYVKTNDGNSGDNVADNLIDPTGLPGPKPWADLPRDVYWWQTYSSMVSGDVFLVGQDNNGKLIVARLSPGGTLDKTFGGAGTGFVTIDPHPSPAVAVINDCCTGWYSVRLSQDGQRMYFAYSHHGSDGQVSGEIGRIHVAGILAGQRDETFGVHGSIPFALPAGGLWEQSPGDLLVALDGAVFRLSAGSGRSPGIIGFRTTGVASRYGDTPTIKVGRYAGNDGAVSISYRTVDSTADIPRIYEPTSGQLQWADGDSADKSFSVRVLPQLSAVSKGFDLLLENPVGGALTQNSQVNLWVTADTPPVLSQPIVPAPPSVGSSPYPGGGGSADPLSLFLLMLGSGAAMRRRLRL